MLVPTVCDFLIQLSSAASRSVAEMDQTDALTVGSKSASSDSNRLEIKRKEAQLYPQLLQRYVSRNPGVWGKTDSNLGVNHPSNNGSMTGDWMS